MDITGLQAYTPLGWELEQLSEYHFRAHIEQPKGEGKLNCYLLLPGLFLLDINLNCTELPAQYPTNDTPFTLNWCMDGRCEVDLGNKGSLLVAKQNLCISDVAASSFSYPTGNYQGLELLLNTSLFDDAAWQLLQTFGLGLADIQKLFSSDLPALVCSPQGQLEEALTRLEQAVKENAPSKEQLLLRSLELLVYLKQADQSTLVSAGTYLMRSQRDMAEYVRTYIENSASSQLNLSSLSQELGVSEATLKTYFSKVYGKTPRAYAHEQTLEQAAQLLQAGDEQISTIASISGYTNASKFSAAFAKQYGMAPIEYRRRYRLEHITRDKEGM